MRRLLMIRTVVALPVVNLPRFPRSRHASILVATLTARKPVDRGGPAPIQQLERAVDRLNRARDRCRGRLRRMVTRMRPRRAVSGTPTDSHTRLEPSD